MQRLFYQQNTIIFVPNFLCNTFTDSKIFFQNFSVKALKQLLIRVWNMKFMPRMKKNFKLGIYYHFLVQIWSLELNSWQYVLDIEIVQSVTMKLEIPDTKITQTA